MTVREAYEQRYGANAKTILRSFGVDPAPIIDKYGSRVGEEDPLADMLGMPPATAEDGTLRELLRESNHDYVIEGASRTYVDDA